jgi:hypothetical protein
LDRVRPRLAAPIACANAGTLAIRTDNPGVDTDSSYTLSTIEDIKQAIRKNPTDLSYADRLANEIAMSGKPWFSEILDFCTQMDQDSGQKFAAALQDSGVPLHPIHYSIIYNLCSSFPSSSIPLAFMHLKVNQLGFVGAEYYIVEHIRSFPTNSSLVDVLLDKERVFFNQFRRNEVWRCVFQDIDILDADAFSLAREIREGHIGRMENRAHHLRAMWEDLLRIAKLFSNKNSQDFLEFQLVLCDVEFGDLTDGFQRLVARWSGRDNPSYDREFRELGKRLALKNKIKLLVECWWELGGLGYRTEFSQGAMDGFREAGNVKGLLQMGVELQDEWGLRELVSKLGD